VVSSTPRPPLPPGNTRYPFYRRLGGPQSRSGRAENRDSIPDRPPHSISHEYMFVCVCVYIYIYIYIYTHTHTHLKSSTFPAVTQGSICTPTNEQQLDTIIYKHVVVILDVSTISGHLQGRYSTNNNTVMAVYVIIVQREI